MKKIAAIFTALLCVATACDVSSIQVSVASTPNSLNADAFDDTAVSDHFGHVRSFEYFPDINSTFACVDARRDTLLFGTPGGDFGEMVVAIRAYTQLAGITPTQNLISQIFLRFMSEVATADRPFYFHTDTNRMSMFLRDLANFSISATIFPDTAPPQAAIWLREFVKSQYQGCGHIRLMIDDPSAYGLDNAFIPQTLMQEFVRYWWAADESDKKKIDFSVKLGALQGRAVTVVNNAGPGCTGYSPKYYTNLYGSSVFMFHAGAVGNFRSQVLAPFFKRFDSNVNTTALVGQIQAVFDTQLTSTLTLLPPANGVRVFSVRIGTSGNPPPATTGSNVVTPPPPTPAASVSVSVIPSFLAALMLLVLAL